MGCTHCGYDHSGYPYPGCPRDYAPLFDDLTGSERLELTVRLYAAQTQLAEEGRHLAGASATAAAAYSATPSMFLGAANEVSWLLSELAFA